MKKLFSPKPQKLRNNDSQAVNILTSPLFVVGLVVVCFGILTPKIFMPLFMQIFGLNKPQPEKPIHNIPNFDPRMRSGKFKLKLTKYAILCFFMKNKNSSRYAESTGWRFPWSTIWSSSSRSHAWSESSSTSIYLIK